MNSSIPKAKQKQYADYVKQITPTHSLPMNMAKAFLTGGVICVVGQIITNFAKSRGLDQDMAGTWCSVTLVFISVFLLDLIFIQRLENLAEREVWFQSPVLLIP